MKLKKTICALAVALSIGAAGCGKAHSEYTFDEEIAGESVKFSTGYKFLIPDNNYLNVVRQDGASVQYCDESFSNLKLEKVCITPVNEKRMCYFDDEVGTEALAEAQIQFNDYLVKILDYKQQESMDLINEKKPEEKK
jgi:hypothetical protein